MDTKSNEIAAERESLAVDTLFKIEKMTDNPVTKVGSMLHLGIFFMINAYKHAGLFLTIDDLKEMLDEDMDAIKAAVFKEE